MAIDLSVFADIEANLAALDIDEIKTRLHPLMKGGRVTTPLLNPGVFLYHGRKISPTFNKDLGISRDDLSYRRKELVTELGRLNRPRMPMFYCCVHKPCVFFELQGLQPGDEIILSFWKTTEKMFVNNIGYAEYVFELLGAKRPVPQWRPASSTPTSSHNMATLPAVSDRLVKIALSRDENHEVREAFSRYFMTTVGPLETNKYKITTAIGELHLGNIDQIGQFAGVLYPSARMWANGDNLALLPWYVDTHLQFRKAVHVRIDDRTDTTFSVTYLDTAKEFGTDGKLIWLGRLPNWTLQPNQAAVFTDTPGVDEDGDYQSGKDGGMGHWVAVDADTGQRLEPS